MFKTTQFLFLLSILLFRSCNERKDQNAAVPDQYKLEQITVNLEKFHKETLDFNFTVRKNNVEYIILDTTIGINLNHLSKSVIDTNHIFFLSIRNNAIFIFGKDGSFISQHTNKSLNLGVLTDFSVSNEFLTIWDGKKDIISIFKISKNGGHLTKEVEIKPTFEINSFWKLNSGDYLATVSSWNVPSIEDELLITDSRFETTKKGYYRNLGNADDDYILSNSYFHLFNNKIHLSHSTDNLTFLFDETGKLLRSVEIKYGENAPAKLLSSLEKNAYELSNYFFINGYTYITDNFIAGSISKGLSQKKSFIADTLSRKLYIENRPYSSFLSNTLGSYKDKIISILIPGQYNLAKDSDFISDEVKRALKKGAYVICLTEL
ncbi:hypothetical protein [Sphingobacterium corticibacter]|uniref:6-bladed beta-propeller n=1 Tax=Sphingobacterium corticibacter TaxID=2171749 RepID=A0A2T8HJP5_9SPHI|nr:hypothetical protein [Sphingobacterium corticibacter]PVH25664.1 hypothetical protein DC487_06895 [Sphingobacterium corticibacter]